LVTAESPRPLKRFYTEATAEDASSGAACRVLLDGKPVKTPKGSFLALPSRALAEAVATEWRNQSTHVRPKEMPLTTIGCTVIDLVLPETPTGPGSNLCVDRMLPYLETDTVCYEDDHEPLADLQRSEWGPLRQWYENRLGVQLAIATGLSVPAHPEATLEAVRQDLQNRGPWELCALEIATTTAKSLVVATALLDRDDVAAEQALRWAILEEYFQIERWGLVEGEHDVAHQEALLWLNATQRFVQLCAATVSS